MGFISNFIRLPAVQNFGKLVKISESYKEFKRKMGSFWDTV